MKTVLRCVAYLVLGIMAGFALAPDARPTEVEVVGVSVYEVAGASCVTVVTEAGSGSGFVVGRGVIATAKHVVEGATEISVCIGDATFHVFYIYLSEEADIAILEFLGDYTAALTFGDLPRVGDQVFAVGSPFGLAELRGYVSAGIISGIGRDVENFGTDMILTDAPINPGNSGGPLINSRGEVVGMAVATIMQGDGIGLCLPISQVRAELDRFYAEQGMLGLSAGR